MKYFAWNIVAIDEGPVSRRNLSTFSTDLTLEFQIVVAAEEKVPVTIFVITVWTKSKTELDDRIWISFLTGLLNVIAMVAYMKVPGK